MKWFRNKNYPKDLLEQPKSIEISVVKFYILLKIFKF